MKPIDRILPLLQKATRNAKGGWEALCPAHDDRRRSLGVAVGADGRVLLSCGAGCSVQQIVQAFGLTQSDLFAGERPKGGIEAEYDYRDEAGVLLFQVVRKHPKTFLQRRPDGKGGWVWNLGGVARVLYRLPELLSADVASPVFITEGEKDADNLRRLGLVATTNPGGAGKWQSSYSQALSGRIVMILPDNDPAGMKHAREVSKALAGVAASVRIVELPGLPPKGDVSDWIAIGGTAAALLEHSRTAKSLDSDPPLEEWEPPIPLESFADVPSFPVEALPPWLGCWTQATAEATQTPPDAAACLALAVCGAALAGKFRVQARAGWTEPVNLYVVVVLPVGNRKSAIFAEMLAPVSEFEREESDRRRVSIAAAGSRKRTLEYQLNAKEKEAARAKDEERIGVNEDCKRLAAELAGLDVPSPPQLFTEDFTVEKLANMLARQGGRMLIASAEGTPFEIARGRYSELPNFDVFLKGHSGDRIRVNRLGREPDDVEHPALSLAVTVQPHVIEGLAEEASMRGKGFLSRFLYSIPRSLVGRRRIATPGVTPDVRLLFRNGLLSLWRLPGAAGPEGETCHMLRLSGEAERLLREFELWLEPQLGDEQGDLNFVKDWCCKVAGAAIRLAGVMHVAETAGEGLPWSDPIPPETMRNALAISREYFLPHAKAAYGLMGADPRIGLGRKLLDWIKAERKALFSRRDAYRAIRHRLRKIEEVDPVLDLLANHGYLAPVEQEIGIRGRKPSQAYRVHPIWLASGNAGQMGQNSA